MDEWNDIEQKLKRVRRLSNSMFLTGGELKAVMLPAQLRAYHEDNPPAPTFSEQTEINQALETVRRMKGAVPRSQTIRAMADLFLAFKGTAKGTFLILRRRTTVSAYGCW